MPSQVKDWLEGSRWGTELGGWRIRNGSHRRRARRSTSRTCAGRIFSRSTQSWRLHWFVFFLSCAGDGGTSQLNFFFCPQDLFAVHLHGFDAHYFIPDDSNEIHIVWRLAV